MLATEHWSLLAVAVTTQSEVLTRIAIFLTLVSAGLVTLGVLGNATEFRGWFGVAALGVLFLLVLLGLITLLRVYNTATEDLDVRARDEPPAGRLRRPRSGHRARTSSCRPTTTGPAPSARTTTSSPAGRERRCSRAR